MNFYPPPTVIPSSQKNLLATIGPASVGLNAAPATASTSISSKSGLPSVMTTNPWIGVSIKQPSSTQGLNFSGFPSENDLKITSPIGAGMGDFSRLHFPHSTTQYASSPILQPNKQVVQAQVLMTVPEPPQPQYFEEESAPPTATTKPTLSVGSFSDFMADALFSKKTT